MDFLANENFPFPSIKFLREAGHNVISVSESLRGASDLDIIEKATSENLTILTFDKDYGEIIFKYNYKNPPAVIFFRFKGETPGQVGQILINLLDDSNIDFNRKFSVIEKESIRQRTY